MFILRALLVTTVLVAMGTATTQELDTKRDAGFIAALLAEARHASIPADMDLYGSLLGSWELRGMNYRVEGKPEKVIGRVEVARVLDGRAIQDIWIFQLDNTQPFDARNRRVGTTLRIYDPVDKVWKATWLDPVTRGRTQLTARRQGGNIVHIGANVEGRPMRWTFTNITDTSFAWRGEHSENGGRTWKLNAEYFAHRVPAAKP